MESDREEAAIGAADEMSEATERVRDRGWMLAGGSLPRRPPAQFRRVQASGETTRSVGEVATFTSSVHADHAVLAVSGQLDINTAPALRQRLFDLFDQGHRLVVADLSGVDFMDSGGLSALVGGLKRGRQLGGQLHVVATARELAQLFRVTGVYKVLPLYDSVEAATRRA